MFGGDPLSEKIRILLVESDPMWAEGISKLIGQSDNLLLIGSLDRKQDVLHLIKCLNVDVVLLDMMLESNIEGLSAIQDILEIKPEAKIILMSCREEGKFIWEAFSLGVVNYIVKSSGYHDILTAIHDAYYDKAAIHPSSATVIRKEFRKIRQEKLGSLLTNQERNILRFVDQGKSTSEIRQLLCIEVHTVENYISSINKKLQTKNRKDAVKCAKRLGLLYHG